MYTHAYMHDMLWTLKIIGILVLWVINVNVFLARTAAAQHKYILCKEKPSLKQFTACGDLL